MAEDCYLNFDSDFFDKYATLAYYLSKGASGNAYGPINWHGLQLAIKQVMFEDGKVTDQFKKDIEAKKAIWTSIEHKHLMRIRSVDLNRLPKVMFIVMDFAAGGSLKKTLRSLGSENKLPIDVVTNWAKQIADGMLYLHEKNIVHRDLKPANILLMEPFGILNYHTMMTLKITDFDDVKKHDHTTTMSLVGTFAYMAPEVLQNQWFSKASDVWSYGVVIWEMLSGDIPYKGLEPTRIIHKSMSGELDNLPLDQSFPNDYNLLLNSCWASAYTQRPSFQDIFCNLEHMAQMQDVNEPQKKKRRESANFQDTLKVSDEVYTENERLQYGREKFKGDQVALNDILQQRVPAIYGLAVLGQEVFISRLQSPDIEVYNSKTFHFKRQMEVDGMTKPEHIASCHTNICIYAFDWNYQGQFNAILRIDPTNGNLIVTWNIDGGGGRLSVASDTNVILNINYDAKLHEYTADGILIRIINLGTSTGIIQAWHAVKLNSGLFVVCHGDYEDPLSRVCLLSVKVTSCTLGRTDKVDILNVFGGKPGESINRLRRPMYLSVDKEGSILVSDASNKRAVLLSSNLDAPKILIAEEDGLGLPWRTCFDESTGQWFVADYNRVALCLVKNENVKRQHCDLVRYKPNWWPAFRLPWW